MGSYRKEVRERKSAFDLPMKSKRGTQLFYQFRQAQTFKELVGAFEAVSARFPLLMLRLVNNVIYLYYD
jgi:hypothetical protein